MQYRGGNIRRAKYKERSNAVGKGKLERGSPGLQI